jgi:hypothetical protein
MPAAKQARLFRGGTGELDQRTGEDAMSVVPIGLPVVKKPESLEDLFRRACATPGPRALVEWIFIEARAKGRLAVAERELRELENQRFCILHKTWGTDSDAARDLLMRHGPSPMELGLAQAEVATATEIASACARMIELSSRNKEATK